MSERQDRIKAAAALRATAERQLAAHRTRVLARAEKFGAALLLSCAGSEAVADALDALYDAIETSPLATAATGEAES